MGANRGQHWSDTEIAALLDIWGDDKIQTQLNGAYRNDSVFQKIAAALATRGFKRSGKQCRDKLKALKKKYKDIIDKQRSGAGIESEEEGIEDNFKFSSQLNSVLGTRAVVNPPVLLEIGLPSTRTSTGSIASTPDATGPNTPATEEPSTDGYRQTETEDSESRVSQKEVDNTVPSSQGESSRKKRKLTKVEKAEKAVTTLASQCICQETYNDDPQQLEAQWNGSFCC